MSSAQWLSTLGPMAEVVAELNPTFERKHKLDGRNIGVLLGDLTEVHEAMRMADALEDLPQMREAEWDDAATAALKAHFLKGRRRIAHFLAAATTWQPGQARRPSPMPRPDRYFIFIRDNDLIVEGRYGDSQRARIAQASWSRFYNARMNELKTEVDQLRAEIGPIVQKLGPAGRQLEHLDHALHQSILSRSESQLDRLGVHLLRQFKPLFIEATGALSKKPEPEEVLPWFEPDGWATQYGELVMRYLRTTLQFRLQPLRALVEAACHLQAPPRLRREEKEPTS